MDGRISEPPPYQVHNQDKSGFHQIDPNVGELKEPLHPAAYPQQPGYPSQDPSHNTVVYYQPMPINTVTVTTVDNNMTCAVLSCLCCFWPVGVFAIMYSCEVKPALLENDITKASMMAEKSRRFSKIALLVGILICVISAIVRIVLASV